MMKKRTVSLFLAAVMLLMLASCAGNQNDDQSLTGNDVITMMVPSSPSWPFREDWKIWDYIEEGTGATLEITSLPSSDLSTKLPLIFSSQEMVPDVIAFTFKDDSDTYASQGALVPFSALEEQMPVYNAWAKSLSEDEYKNIIDVRKSFDGDIYYTPGTGREATTRVRAWLYREDIFKKHNLQAPKTFDELYEVCKALKTIYPDSYPLCFRQKFENIDVTGSSWQKWWEIDAYYDFDNGTWRWGAREDVSREMLTWYKKMIDEKLLPANFFNMNVAEWEELITTERGFIMPNYQTRIDYFTPLVKDRIPDFKFQAFEPPVATENGVSMVGRYNTETNGFSIPNSGDENRIAKAAKFVDWFYTDEAKELVSWGKEGETYEIKDGKKNFISDEKGTDIGNLYGFQLYGTFTRLDPEAVLIAQSETIAETRDMVIEHTLPYMNPTQWLSFNEKEQKIVDEYFAACMTYSEEMFAKFMLGQEPISNFDKFVQNINEMGVDKLLAAYESAYNRVK